MEWEQFEISSFLGAEAKGLIQMSLFNLSLQQRKVMLYIADQLSPEDEDSMLYEFSIREFCEACGIESDSGKNYADIKTAIIELSMKNIWVKLDDASETTVRWIERPFIDEGSGIIQIELDELMKPYLLQLKEMYTQCELLLMFSFKSKYTMRMYELIKTILLQDPEACQREYDLDEFRRLLGAETYQTYQDFKTRALIPSIEEINQCSDMIVSYEPVKRGRSVAKLLLAFGPKPPKREERSELELNQVSLWDAPEGEGRL